MRILLTARSLVASGGVEMYLLDVCRQFIRMGHAPCAYAPRLGPIADAFYELAIPVVDDLSRLSASPDVIHGNYGLTTYAAALRFAQTPAVHMCHAWYWPGDVPPLLPNVRRWLAVDETCRERLLCQHGLPDESVLLLQNGVDLERFQLRAPLPERPNIAVAFSNYMTPEDAQPIRQACNAAGIELHTLGRNLGNEIAKPEAVLGQYDVVFAKGRSAWEAVASGCAVIVADQVGLGPLVTRSELPSQRKANFGRRLMVDPLSCVGVAERLADYDPADAAAASEILRSENSVEQVANSLLSIYEAVIEEQRLCQSVAFCTDSTALVQFAEQLCLDITYQPPPRAKDRSLRARLTRLRNKITKRAA